MNRRLVIRIEQATVEVEVGELCSAQNSLLSWFASLKSPASSLPSGTSFSSISILAAISTAKHYSIIAACALAALNTISASAAVHYVDAGSTNPTPPYTNWATAASVIQAAVDAAAAGDEIVVTNGVYATGGRAVVGTMTNRVAVDKPLILRSVSGPQFTMIQGYRAPGMRYSGNAIRCVYLSNGASLSGFTLTNGSTRTWASGPGEQRGGGVLCEPSAVVSNCVLVGNSGWDGGGACGGTLYNCVLTGNSANRGAMANGTLNNCAVIGNTGGGGAYNGALNNCTVIRNSADWSGGGVYDSTVNNSILYYNSAPYGPNHQFSILNYCCTIPLPPEGGGTGNIGLDPELASDWHLSATSPCRRAANSAYATGTDIDGEPWANQPSIGCDEYYGEAASGVLKVGIAAVFTNAVPGYPVEFRGLVDGQASASAWEFGDGVVLSNRPYVSHAWAAMGDYSVVLRAHSENHATGVSTSVTVHVVAQPVHYVSAASARPLPPYGSWDTAARNLQDAVDAATTAGALVLVTNGLYAAGGRAVYGAMTNRVAVDKPLMVRSVNGPQLTVIQGLQVPATTNGDGAIRCAYLTNGASLCGFTLTNGATRNDGDLAREQSGGGLWCEWEDVAVSNCVIVASSAQDWGGGTIYGALNNCALMNNTAGGAGGAAFSTLENCTLTGNSAYFDGGGAYLGTLNNSIVYFNTAPEGPNYSDYSQLDYCCTIPVPLFGVGNITNAPLFVDQVGGNLRLLANSPCINGGNNTYVPGSIDLDGNPRIAGGTVDIGAYEFQSPTSVVSYAWLQQYGFPTDGSADLTDADGDGLNNWQEWRCGTDPINAASALRLLSAFASGTNVTVAWQSVAGVNYNVERSTNLSGQPPAFAPLATDIPGQPGSTALADTTAVGSGPVFYRVGVGLP